MRRLDPREFRRFGAFALCGVLMAGCATDASMKHAPQAAASGATASPGARVSHVGRAVIGGMAGAAVGGVIARYMDEQAKELAQAADAQRVDDGIIVTIADQILFGFDSADLKPESRDTLRRLAEIFKRYDKTNLTIAGNTDNVGRARYNIQLSERRAKAVAEHLAGLGVMQARLRIMGFGFARPAASNDSAEGRARNRRVEIHIAPNEDLRKEDQSISPK